MDVAEGNSERIGVRTTPNVALSLRRAAVPSRGTVAEFLFEAEIDAAEDASADRRMFRLDDKRRRAFPDIPDGPVSDRSRSARPPAGKSTPEWRRGIRTCPRSGSSMRRTMSSPSRGGGGERSAGR